MLHKNFHVPQYQPKCTTGMVMMHEISQLKPYDLTCSGFKEMHTPPFIHGADALAGLDVVIAHKQVLLDSLAADGLRAVEGVLVLWLLCLPALLHIAWPVIHLHIAQFGTLWHCFADQSQEASDNAHDCLLHT